MKTPVSPSVPERGGGGEVYTPLGASFFEVVPLVEFMYLGFTRTPGGVTVGDSGLCGCVPCLSSAVISLRLSNENTSAKARSQADTYTIQGL